MWVGYHSMFTFTAVVSPPRPCGPTPVLQASSSSSSSSLAYLGSRFLLSASRAAAYFAISAALSIVPPMPTPITIGGQAFGPASLTVSKNTFFTPSRPSAGTSIFRADLFSLPKPFGATFIWILSPLTILTFMTAGVLFVVFLRSNIGSFTTDLRR